MRSNRCFGCSGAASGLPVFSDVQNAVGDDLAGEIRAFIRKNVLETLPGGMVGGRMGVNTICPFPGTKAAVAAAAFSMGNMGNSFREWVGNRGIK
jgi:hypothetical protein